MDELIKAVIAATETADTPPVLSTDLFQNTNKIIDDINLVVKCRSKISDAVWAEIILRCNQAMDNNEIDTGSRKWGRIVKFLDSIVQREQANTKMRLEMIKLIYRSTAPAVNVNINNQPIFPPLETIEEVDPVEAIIVEEEGMGNE